MRNVFSSISAGLDRVGKLGGKILGRTITDPDSALNSFASLVQGKVNEGLKFAADAGKVAVKTLKSLATMPFASSENEMVPVHAGAPRRPSGP